MLLARDIVAFFWVLQVQAKITNSNHCSHKYFAPSLGHVAVHATLLLSCICTLYIAQSLHSILFIFLTAQNADIITSVTWVLLCLCYTASCESPPLVWKRWQKCKQSQLLLFYLVSSVLIFMLFPWFCSLLSLSFHNKIWLVFLRCILLFRSMGLEALEKVAVCYTLVL